MDEGLQLIYWMPRQDGSSFGVLLERARWVADLTAALPDSSPLLSMRRDKTMVSTGFTALADESQDVVYRWGADGECLDTPLASHPLSMPLASWQLEYHNDNPLPGSSSAGLIASLAGIGVVLLGIGAYVLTGVQRQMRAAKSRVSFASQVSHELRTPLTNIRLYAELAESDLEKLPASDSRDSIEKRLAVIDTESRRLGRLVSGVLEMIRDRGKQQGPRIAPISPDEVIDKALVQFVPSFANANLQVIRDLQTPKIVGLDSDILEMILVNLLSNVEKYASDGERLDIASVIQGDDLIVRVSDQGPGIPWSKRKVVFRPFARLDDSIHAPSGTGIGLTIARRLARRHGGELKMISVSQGASFELRMPIQQFDEMDQGRVEGGSQ
jgi:signal transduction histidine kinase